MPLSLTFFIVLAFFSWASAQSNEGVDTLTRVKAEDFKTHRSSKRKRGNSALPRTRNDPRRALFYSAVLPGAGQIYNGKYWKVPLVLGGLVGGIYIISYHHDQYLGFKKELYGILSNNNPSGTTSRFTADQLRDFTDRSKRDRDFFTIITGLWYILQALEAHVDAHLKFFDDNIGVQVKLEPIMENNPFQGRSIGFGLVVRF